MFLLSTRRYQALFEFKVLPNFLVKCIKYIISPMTDNGASISAKAGAKIPNRHGHGQQVSSLDLNVGIANVNSRDSKSVERSNIGQSNTNSSLHIQQH
jgi:hypothetical protein